MLHPAVLSLILACTVSFCNSAEILENGMPIGWSQTFSQVSEVPMKDGMISLDPWNFRHRMTFYRLMLDATDPSMNTMGTNSTDFPLWGPALQLGWLKTSGRLADPTGGSSCGLPTGFDTCISSKSYWGCLNYYTSALPFLSAVQQGLLGAGVQAKLLEPEGVTEYCTTYADCSARFPDAMSKWDALFKGLKDLSGSPLSNEEKVDRLRGLFWEAQVASLQEASIACNAKQSHYSSVEMAFVKDWISTVDYLAASHVESNLARSPVYISLLPSRPLIEGDVAPHIANMTKGENHMLASFSWMSKIDSIIGGTLANLWKNVMCSRTTREKGRELMEKMFLDPKFVPYTFISLSVEMAKNC